MKQFIDRTTWRRRDNFAFFENYANPFISFTAQVECRAGFEKARARGDSFFLGYLYAITRAANRIEELRYRFWGPDNRIVLYDKVDVYATIRTGAGKDFVIARIPYQEDFAAFLKGARRIVDGVDEQSDLLAPGMASQVPDHDVVMVSALPGLRMTSFVPAQAHARGSDYPLFMVGKAERRGEGLYMPVSIACHHGFVDGAHVEEFFRLTEKFLSEL